MDDKLFQLIVSRIDKIEEKVDKLLEFKWRVAGIAIAVAVLGASIFELVTAFIQRT